MDSNLRKFFVFQGGSASDIPGPATRLGLYERCPAPNKRELALVIATKVILLGAMLYFIHGIR